MSDKTKRIIAGFEHVEGSYEIENYLFGDQVDSVTPGCWIYGDTVYGDMRIGAENWGTYSVPVMAYLVHMNTVRLPTKVKHHQEVAVVNGYSSSVTSSIEADLSLGGGFIAIAGGELKLTHSSTEGITGSTTRSQKIEMEGPGTFNIYQVHIAYAHCATSAGPFAHLFKYAKTIARPTARQPDREDLFFMTSIATNTIVPVSSKNSSAPLSWADIQEAGLMEGYDPEVNGGMWSIDYSAFDTPGSHY